MKRLLTLALALIMVMAVVACNNTPAVTTEKQDPAETPAGTPVETPAETPEETPAETEPVDEAKLDEPIDLAGITVVVPAEATDRHIMYAYDAFINGFNRMAKIEVAISTAEQDIEVLIGDTGRSESEALKATLGADEFAVKLIGKKLVVVATDNAFLYEAVTVLLDFIRIDTNADVSEGKITLKRAIDVKTEGNKESYVYLFSKSDTISAQGKLYNTFNPVDKDIRACQGGCIASNGYYYQGYIWHDGNTEANNKVIVVKYDFEKKTKIAQSEILSLNHCNDLTYNAELNLIAIINHGPNANLITFLDPDTLEVVRTQKIGAHIYALTYCYERDRYMTGISGGQDLRRWTGDFIYNVKDLRIYATPKTANYTTQGICSDENFVYCVLWDSKGYGTAAFQNVITVYDWYGNFVGIINIDVTKLEPENISIVDGTIYVTCHTSYGARMFKMKVEG